MQEKDGLAHDSHRISGEPRDVQGNESTERGSSEGADVSSSGRGSRSRPQSPSLVIIEISPLASDIIGWPGRTKRPMAPPRQRVPSDPPGFARNPDVAATRGRKLVRSLFSLASPLSRLAWHWPLLSLF